jgi:ribonuclease HI
LGTELKIYTDGGCSGNPGPGGWAYIITEVGDRAQTDQIKIIAEKWGAEKNTTNNRMELLAAISSLEAVKASLSEDIAKALSPDKVTLYTDSQYVQKGMTSWVKNWKENQWKTSGKESVKNKDLWLRLDSLANQFEINWVWIRGHAGNVLNERCDRMTQEAIMSVK